MKKEGSTASMLWLDIRRGFCSKRFWGIVGVVTIVFVVFLTLDASAKRWNGSIPTTSW